MLFRKLLRTIGLYKAQFISMIIMIALGIGIFVGFNMEWTSLKKNTDRFFEETNFADYRITDEKGFSAEAVDKVAAIDGVKAASRYLSANVDVKERAGDTIAFTVTENFDVSSFLLLNGTGYDASSEDGIWIAEAYAGKNGLNIGDSLTLVYKGKEMSGVIKGLVQSSEYLVCTADKTQVMPDYTKHGFAYVSPAFYKKAMGGRDYYPQINVISSMESDDFKEAVNATLGKTTFILSKEESGAYALAKGEIEEGQTMGSIIPVMFLLIAVLTMVTTMHRIAAKEKTQIGTLKALGFKDKKILVHYTSYATIIGLIGSVIGIGIGYGVAAIILSKDGSMGTYLDMPYWSKHMPWFGWLAIVAVIAALTLIGFLSVKSMLKGTAADALRPYSPKKMKPLAIEKTKLWKKLSFGVRWNMRDIMRHKSRTFMSLFGIFGCMMLMVGGLGMRDTFNALLDSYYDSALNYNAKINLSEEATEEEINKLIAAYNGDYGATVAVEIGDNAVALEIYGITHDKIRFLDKKNRNVYILDDGAFICKRIADKNNLSEGDYFEFSPFGTDDKYKVRVSKVIHSTTESVIISTGYADSLGIKYKADAIYTDTVSTDVAANSAIKNVQSKQDLMDSFDTITEIMNLMVSLLVVAALVLGVVVLYNLGVMSYTERYREMATLKVVGFKDKKIGRLLIGQNLWVTIVGMALGLPAGVGLLYWLLEALASEYEMVMKLGPATYLISILLTLGVSLAVSFAIACKNKKIDMVEALKGAE